MLIDPTNLTVGDLVGQALREAKAIGVGQTPLAQDNIEAQFRLQLMLQEWERESLLVYHKVTFGVVSTGQQSYSVGPSGEINTSKTTIWQLANAVALGGTGYAINDTVVFQSGIQISITGTSPITFTIVNGGYATNPLPTSLTQVSTSGSGTGLRLVPSQWTLGQSQLTASNSVRPSTIYSAFVRQINNPGNLVDYPLSRLEAKEDYNKLALKSLSSFPSLFYYDPTWPLGQFYPWPVPQANIYECFITILEQLPISWANSAAVISLPYEYFSAILYNLAIRLVSKYGRSLAPGDPLVNLAKQTLDAIRPSYAQIAELSMPRPLVRLGIYNIFSDTTY